MKTSACRDGTLKNHAHQKNLYMHLAYSHPLNENNTQHCSLHSFPYNRQSISAMFSSNKISQHNSQHTIQIQYCSQFLHTRQTIPANYIAATYNVTHSPYTSTCTTHPALPFPLPSTTLLCTHLTNTKHRWQNGTRCRDGVNVLWRCSHLVWLVFEGSIPTCACFHSENFL